MVNNSPPGKRFRLVGACLILALIVVGWWGYRTAVTSARGMVLLSFVLPPAVTSEQLRTNLDSDDDDLVRESLAVLRRRNDPAGEAQAVELLESGDSYVWLNAATYLGSLGNPEATPYLIRGLEHRAWRGRAQQARYLEQITGESFGTDQAAWIAWWKETHPEDEFDFEILENRRRAEGLETGSTIHVTVTSPTGLSHMGAKLDLAGIQLAENADPVEAEQLLRTLAHHTVVRLKVAPKYPAYDTRVVLAYFMFTPSEDLRLREGMTESPLEEGTLLNAYLGKTDLYDVQPEQIEDEYLRRAMSDALSER